LPHGCGSKKSEEVTKEEEKNTSNEWAWFLWLVPKMLRTMFASG
jgi:hypothetical protein